MLRIAVPGGHLFDFGAGSGLDARFYASCGFTVSTYDSDAGACKVLEHHCRDEIAAGAIRPYRGDYASFLRDALAQPQSQAALITSNFAPLNLVDDLPTLFRALHALCAPGGKLVASILGPGYWRDLRYPWWWRNRLRYWTSGEFAVVGAGKVWRRSCQVFGARARPYFRLAAIERGVPDGGMFRPDSRSLQLRSARFLFLHFERV